MLTGRRCWAADSQGRIEVFDVAAGKLHGAMQPCGGSIRALALQPDDQLLASVGLDRYLRLHSTQTRKTVTKVYLKQQLTGTPSLDLHMASLRRSHAIVRAKSLMIVLAPSAGVVLQACDDAGSTPTAGHVTCPVIPKRQAGLGHVDADTRPKAKKQK